MKSKIVIIEDEPSIADTIIYALETDSMLPIWVSTGSEGVETVKREEPDLILLDVGLPDISGFEVCRNIRSFSDVPVVFLTARSDEIDRIVGLELGADDYISKPFSPRELTARIRAILRRTSNSSVSNGYVLQSAHTVTKDDDADECLHDDFIISQVEKTIIFKGELLTLSRNEFKILELLLGSLGQIFSRSQIMDYAWEEPDISFERTVDTHIKNIRNKLRVIDPLQNPIITKRGFGYGLKK